MMIQVDEGSIGVRLGGQSARDKRPKSFARTLLTMTALLFLSAVGAPILGQTQTAVTKEKWRSINIAVYPDTISPKEIKVVGRLFRLRVANHVGVGQIKFELIREAGAKLSQVQLAGESAKGSDELALEPGTYLLQVAGRPAWTCRINVTAASK